MSQTIFFAGAVIGTLFFGWMIDQYGRVWTMMIATLNILVTGIATPFSNGFLTFAVFRFLMGMSYPTFFLCGYMLGEFEIMWFSLRYRTRAIISRSRFEAALVYKPRILGPTFLVYVLK